MLAIPIQYFLLIVLCNFLDSTNAMKRNEMNDCLNRIKHLIKTGDGDRRSIKTYNVHVYIRLN